MAESLAIACSVDDIDPSFARWQEMMRPEPCQQALCSEPADRYCSWCRSLFCSSHGLHDCIRGQRRIDQYGEAA